jgi:orotate phosphoribosyltransferase
MKTVEKLTAEKLLKIKAVKLQPSNPFTWASGWKSPIYCDNRKLMSYPPIRNFLKVEFSRIILEKFPQVEAIAGVATGAIAPGAIVADALGLPFVYVRSAPKDHGLENLIEGDLKPRQKVVVIEDLVSTGQSSLKAVEAIRQSGSDVLGMVAVFTYGFPAAEANMKEARVDLIALTNYNAILDEALKIDYIAESDVKTLQDGVRIPKRGEPQKRQPDDRIYQRRKDHFSQ